jgi:amidase
MNGLTGLKPTWGRVSRAGVFPLADSLDHIGPMCRSALDCAIVLGAIAGADERDPTAVPMPVPDYAATIASGVAGKRIGLPVNLTGLDADGRRALDGAVQAFNKAGASVVDVTLPAGFDASARDWVPLCAVECAIAHEKTYPSRAAEYGPVLAGLIDAGRRLSATELAHLLVRRMALRGALDKLLASVDLLLMPVMPQAVWSLQGLAAAGRDADTVAARLRFTAPFDMSGHPTLTLPGGMTQEGVPVGFQIVSRAFAEAEILAAGHAYQQATDWHSRRPPLDA